MNRQLPLQPKIRRYALITGGVGYLFALITSPFLPAFISLLIPAVALGAGYLISSFFVGRAHVPVELPPSEPHNSQVNPAPATDTLPPAPAPAETSYTSELRVYIQSIKQEVIRENEQHNLDDEITEKTVELISRVDALLPHIEALDNARTKHDIKLLVMKDLNSVINPFLKLSGTNKLQNRRKLLNGLRDITNKINVISDTIEQQDVYELERYLALVSEKYNAKEIY